MPTKIEKAIAQAFTYYPFGMTAPEHHMGWVYGPTFFVKDMESKHDDEAILALMGDTTKYAKAKVYRERADHIIELAGNMDKEVSIILDKHADKCSARQVTGDGVFELAFPHVRLLKALEYDRLTGDLAALHVSAWKDGELVGFVKGREACEQLRESTNAG